MPRPMGDGNDYELLDFGAGRRLERFGRHVLDRPSPAAEGATPRQPELWRQPTARFERGTAASGRWTGADGDDAGWNVRIGPLTLELRLRGAGQVGLFPEQEINWRWLAGAVGRAGPIKILNLFAYTGASTLAAAAAGAIVTHVDASSSTVAWARRNARLSGLADRPIRWIVEDARAFARREARRGNRYDAVVLDPPAYGHGPKGQSWKIDEHLDELVATCAELCAVPRFVLFTCHSGRLGRGGDLVSYVADRWPGLRAAGTLSGGELHLVSSAGEHLHCGAVARWSGGH